MDRADHELRGHHKNRYLHVNGANGCLSVLLRWLAQAQPDVVCLQELKAPDERFPVDEIEKAEYGSIWHGQKSRNGVPFSHAAAR